MQASIDIQLIGIVLSRFDHVQVEECGELLMLAFVGLERLRVEVRVRMRGEDDQQCGLNEEDATSMNTFGALYFGKKSVVAAKQFVDVPFGDGRCCLLCQRSEKVNGRRGERSNVLER